MKTIAALIIIGSLGWVALSRDGNPPLPARPQATAATPLQVDATQIRKLAGRVKQHVPGGGLLIDGEQKSIVSAATRRGASAYTGPAGPSSYERGEFVLRGVPGEREYADGEALESQGVQVSNWQGTTVLGALRTLRSYEYCALPPATPTPAGAWMQRRGTALDRPVRR